MKATGVISCVLCAAALACGSAPSEPGDVGSTSSASTPPHANPSDSFFACSTDTDCVAVALVENCCYNGWRIAVAQDEVDAYQDSTACHLSKPAMCPLYTVTDKRVPACNATTQLCEMVPPNPQSPPAAKVDL